MPAQHNPIGARSSESHARKEWRGRCRECQTSSEFCRAFDRSAPTRACRCRKRRAWKASRPTNDQISIQRYTTTNKQPKSAIERRLCGRNLEYNALIGYEKLV